jgi:hypothetical protein
MADGYEAAYRRLLTPQTEPSVTGVSS